MTKAKEKRRVLVIPIPQEMWEHLRKISFEKRISMSQLVRWEIEKIINRNKNYIDE